MPTGKIKMFDEGRGFGFIKPDDGGVDVFFHVSALRDGDEITQGKAVKFEIGVDPKVQKNESRQRGFDLKGAPECGARESRPRGLGNSANQTGLLLNGLTPSVDGKPKVSRRCATEPSPRSWRLSSVASDASRTSPTVFRPAALSAFRTLVEKRTLSMGVSSGSSGAG